MPRTLRQAALAFSVAAGLHAGAALADPLGLTEASTLPALLANSFEQLTQLQAQVRTLRETYDETKRLAGYADDTRKAFEAFKTAKGDHFAGGLGQSLDQLFPDAAYMRADLSKPGPWAEGTGELGQQVRFCMTTSGSGGCTELQETLSARRVRDSVHATFGRPPESPAAAEVNAVDNEASVAIAAAQNQENRNKVRAQEAERLRRLCATAEDPVQCAAAADTAQIELLDQTSELTSQVAETNRLHSMRLLQENARRKRELEEAKQRREAVLRGAKEMRPDDVQWSGGEGFFDDGAGGGK